MKLENSQTQVQIGSFGLQGDLFLPDSGETKEIIVFAQGSGRQSLRNRYVAKVLNDSGFGTLLLDLLTPEEEQEESFTDFWRFNTELLANRLVEATDWLEQYFASSHEDPHFKIGFFGSHVGAAAALVAAPKRPHLIKAVVSRGGRVDLAGDGLRKVEIPTLFIVGGEDDALVKLNEEAIHKVGSEEKSLIVVPGASHLFIEPGTLADVASLTREWFEIYLRVPDAEEEAA